MNQRTNVVVVDGYWLIVVLLMVDCKNAEPKESNLNSMRIENNHFLWRAFNMRRNYFGWNYS